jgi:hypothetical protein
VPDEVCAYFKDLGDYDYHPAREVADADENTEVRSVIELDTRCLPRMVSSLHVLSARLGTTLVLHIRPHWPGAGHSGRSASTSHYMNAHDCSQLRGPGAHTVVHMRLRMCRSGHAVRGISGPQSTITMTT